MSTLFNHKGLFRTQEDASAVQAALTFIPINTFHQKRGQFASKPADRPVLFYIHQKGIVSLPYFYAAKLFNMTIMNSDIAHERIYCYNTGTLRPRQVPVVAEAMQYLTQLGTVTLELPTGFGKTRVGAHMAITLGLLTVVIVPRKVLAEQWKKTFESTSNAVVWIVGKTRRPPRVDVLICMDQRYSQIGSIIPYVGTLIIDEAHMLCTASRVGCLLAFQPRYIIVESATMERDDGMHRMMYALAGPHSIFREVDLPITVHCITTGIIPNRTKDRFGNLDYHEFVRSTLHNPRRNHIICHLVYQYNPHTMLIMTKRVDHCHGLTEQLTNQGYDVDYMCSDKKDHRNARIIVGTTSKIGVGYDQATTCVGYGPEDKPFAIMVMGCSFKKSSSAIQNIGRGLRADRPFIIYLLDNDPKYVEHWEVAKRYLDRCGATISYHDMSRNVYPE